MFSIKVPKIDIDALLGEYFVHHYSLNEKGEACYHGALRDSINLTVFPNVDMGFFVAEPEEERNCLVGVFYVGNSDMVITREFRYSTQAGCKKALKKCLDSLVVAYKVWVYSLLYNC